MVSFREAAVDSPAALALLDEYFESRALDFPVAMGTYRPTYPARSAFEAPDGVFLVIEDVDLADEPADVGCGGIRRIPSSDTGLLRFEIKHIWLKPYLRGRGFGRLLLEELERRAVDFGASQLVLDTNESLVAAGRLYRSAGYSETTPYNDNLNATTWLAKTVEP